MPFVSLQRHHGRPGGPAPAAIAADHRPPPGGSEYEKAENGRNKPVDGEQEQDGRCVMHTDPERGYRAAWVLLRAAALRALWRSTGPSISKLKLSGSASARATTGPTIISTAINANAIFFTHLNP